MPITTPRLTISPLRSADVSESYIAWLNDPDINQYLETRHVSQTRATCLAFVRACEKDPHSHLFKIVRRDIGDHIGNIKIGPVNPLYGSGDLSLLIGKKGCQGVGFGTEAIGAVTQWGFSVLRLHRVAAGCYDANLGSLRAFLRAGYTVEGFYREAAIDRSERRIGVFRMAKLNVS
jgi:[ribosomal protein S5]-alanine N-acetyltransferase